MKGVVAALVAVLILGCIGLVLANPPLPQPLQYEQLCENQKISGTGVIDASTSIVDKKIALEYYNIMAGDGDIELDQTHAYSQKAEKLQRNLSAVNNSSASMLNLWENTKLIYNSATTPLTGAKYLNSKAFYGGIGADVKEMFSVNQMEKDQTTFFVSTMPSISKIPGKPCIVPYNPTANCYVTDQQLSPALNYPSTPATSSQLDQLLYTQSLQFAPILCTQKCDTTGETTKMLKNAGIADAASGNENNVSALTKNNPVHLIGIDTKNSFNGTWGIDANWHKTFYKDIKVHEMFTGTFEAEKLIKFHEYPVPENEESPCKGIDC
jgi:hypothetical protein